MGGRQEPGPLCGTGWGQGWGACFISAGTALPTSFPFWKPGSEEPGGKPRGKHSEQCGMLLPSSPRPLPMLPMRRPTTGSGPLSQAQLVSLGAGWFLTHPWGSPYTLVFLSAADSLCADMDEQLRGEKRPCVLVLGVSSNSFVYRLCDLR